MLLTRHEVLMAPSGNIRLTLQAGTSFRLGFSLVMRMCEFKVVLKQNCLEQFKVRPFDLCLLSETTNDDSET